MQRLLMILFLGVASCSSNVSPESGNGGVTREQACTELSTAFCDVYEKCLPVFISIGFGDKATCLSRTQKGCPATLDAPGTSANPNKISTCASSVKNLSCEAIVASTPAACVPDPGTLTDGAACSDDAQCKSTWCGKADDSFCGKCTPLSKDGAACTTFTTATGATSKRCSRGLSCQKDMCITPKTSGATCSETSDCGFGLACFNGKCTLGGKVGAKCDPEGKTEVGCDFLQGAVCNPMTKVCQEIAKANVGQPCGLVGSEYRVCTAGGKCVTPMGMTTGTCLAPAIDGGACDPDKGPDCLAPAKCINKVCKLPDPTLCK